MYQWWWLKEDFCLGFSLLLWWNWDDSSPRMPIIRNRRPAPTQMLQLWTHRRNSNPNISLILVRFLPYPLKKNSSLLFFLFFFIFCNDTSLNKRCARLSLPKLTSHVSKTKKWKNLLMMMTQRAATLPMVKMFWTLMAVLTETQLMLVKQTINDMAAVKNQMEYVLKNDLRCPDRRPDEAASQQAMWDPRTY